MDNQNPINPTRPYLYEYEQLINPETHTGKIVEKEGIAGLLRYMNTEQVFAVATVPANWEGLLSLSKDSPLLGKLGHHAFIHLPGERTCEWSTKKSKLKDYSQVEWRLAKGKTIEKLWRKHLELAPNYHTLGNIFDDNQEGYIHYRLFINDCFVYVNRLLTASDLPETQLSRMKCDKKKAVKFNTIFQCQTKSSQSTVNKIRKVIPAFFTWPRRSDVFAIR